MVEAMDEGNATANTMLEVETLRERLLTQVGGGGGGPRGSLSKCATKYRDYLNEAQSADSTATEQVESSKHELEREVLLYQIEMRKVALMARAAQLESDACDRQQLELNESVQECQNNISELQKIWANEKEKRRNREEYEALAKLANNRPPRRVLQEKLTAVQKDMSELEKQEEANKSEIAAREKQYQLLLQCILDLKSSLNKQTEDLNDGLGKEPEGDADSETEEGGILEMDTAP